MQRIPQTDVGFSGGDNLLKGYDTRYPWQRLKDIDFLYDV